MLGPFISNKVEFYSILNYVNTRKFLTNEGDYLSLWDGIHQEQYIQEKNLMHPLLARINVCQYIGPFIDIVRFEFDKDKSENPSQNFQIIRMEQTVLTVNTQFQMNTDEIMTSYYSNNLRNEINFMIYGSDIYKSSYNTHDSLFLLFQFVKGKYNYEQETVCAHFGCGGFNIKILNSQPQPSLDFPFELFHHSLNFQLLNIFKLENIIKPTMDHVAYFQSLTFMNYSIDSKALMSYFKFLKMNDFNSLSYEKLLYHYEKLRRIRRSLKGFELVEKVKDKFGDIDVKIELFHQAQRKKKVYGKQYNIVLDKLSFYMSEDLEKIRNKYLTN